MGKKTKEIRLVKDCALLIKGRCKKLGHMCCLHPKADLYSCPELVGASREKR